MKRLVVAAVTALLLGSCSSGNSAAKQPEDEFLDKVETACRDANNTIQKIDKTDSAATTDLYNAVSDMSDTLDGLRAPDSLKPDFDTYTSNIDQQVVELKKVTVALAAADAAGQSDAVTALNALRATSDKSVSTLEIFGCLGVVPADGLTVSAAGTTATTVPPDATTAPTASDTVVTAPTTAAPPVTSTTTSDAATTTTVLPGDLSVDSTAPAGYKWVAYKPPDVSGLYANPSIGKLVTYYSGAELQSDADGSTATVYVVKLSQDFDATSTKAYQFWEAVQKGTDVTTPGGLSVHQRIGAFANTDCAVYLAGVRGVTICTYTGYDGLTLMDTFIAANPA